MGFEPLEDTLPLPQIVRTMKISNEPYYGTGISIYDDDASGALHGSGKSSRKARRQEESDRSIEKCKELCDGSGDASVWNEIEYLLTSLEKTKEAFHSDEDWDQKEKYWLEERYRICRQQAMHLVLCVNLGEVIQEATFPGEKLTYLQLAERVVPTCTRRELKSAIKSIGLNPGEQIYFKANNNIIPLERAEQILMGLISDTEYVLSSKFVEELGIPAKSAAYTLLKKSLLDRGWVWKTKKVGGKVVGIIKR